MNLLVSSRIPQARLRNFAGELPVEERVLTLKNLDGRRKRFNSPMQIDLNASLSKQATTMQIFPMAQTNSTRRREIASLPCSLTFILLETLLLASEMMRHFRANPRKALIVKREYLLQMM